MALKPVNTKYVTKLVCDFCYHIQDTDISIPTEYVDEEDD